MFEKQTLLRGALILIVAIAVLEFLQPTVMAIDTSTMPGWESQLVILVQHFFQVTPIALIAGFGWSFFGYLKFRFGDQTVLFEVNKLYSTWMWFEAIIAVVAVGLPLSWTTAIAGIIMAVKSILNQMGGTPPAQPPATTEPTVTGPGPPA